MESELKNSCDNIDKNQDLTIFLIDNHLHFQYYSDDEIKSIVERCLLKSEIRYFITNSTCKNDFERTIKISQLDFSNNSSLSTLKCETYDLKHVIIPGLGHHPWYLEDLDENWFENLEENILGLEKKNSPFIIGEIGIDGGKPKKYY